MTSGTRALAVLVRAAQWALDHAAFELGGGRFTLAQRHQLADELAKLADALRSDIDGQLDTSEMA